MINPYELLNKLKDKKPDGYFVRRDGKQLPRYSEFYNLAKEYCLFSAPGFAKTEEEFIRKVKKRIDRVKDILDLVKKVGGFEKGIKVVDLAAGLGIESLALSYYLNADVIAMDKVIKFKDSYNEQKIRNWLKGVYDFVGWKYSPSDSIEELYTQKNVKWVRSSAEQMNLPKNSVDMVFSLNAIEFFDDFNKTFSEIYRVLKPGGTLYARWSNFYSLVGCHHPGLVDIPWAHMLLAPDEYYDYLCNFEKDANITDYIKDLRRLTLMDWKKTILSLNWEVLRWEYLSNIKEDSIPSFVLNSKPDGLSVDDLVADCIMVVLKKKPR